MYVKDEKIFFGIYLLGVSIFFRKERKERKEKNWILGVFQPFNNLYNIETYLDRPFEIDPCQEVELN